MDTREFRETGHTMIDMIADYLEDIEDQALFPEVAPQHMEALLNEIKRECESVRSLMKKSFLHNLAR
ncbi:MAG: hypothetical protein JSV83_16810 [Desulfobacterales bacterium]|nr:MAG: hypothetical protein JSV83_16810 [Desulfobacterales bacterium]